MSTPISTAEHPTLCPAPEKLGKLLRDELEPTEIGSVEEHIGVCPCCQHLLGRLVGSLPDALAAHGQHGDEAPPDLPGYAVLRRIDAGGMGVVWRVRDLQFGRDLAVKVMASWGCNSPRLTERFLVEAQICAQLTHPSIVPVHSMSRLVDGRPYYTMKLIEGQTLAARLQGGAAPAERRMEFVQIFAQVCQALAFAHGRGVIHRDLKPENVMVGAHGEVQLMDWGLAKKLEEADSSIPSEGAAASTVIESGQAEAARTHAGTVLGTVAYMAPEQALGLIDQVDRQSDVFGLGGILCKILTGEPPYSGANAGILRLRAVQTDLGETLARLHGCGADPELIQLAQRCLAARKADRPADAGAVASQLAAYQAGVQQRLRQAELDRAAAQATAAAERAARWRTRALALAVLALVTLAAAGASLAAWRLEHERDRAVANQRAAEQAEEQTKEQMWNSQLAQARANRWSGRVGRNFDSLNVLKRAAAFRPSLELRNEAIACMALPDLRLARQWDYGAPRSYGFAFDAELERYAFSDEQGTIAIRRFADNRELRCLPGSGVPVWVLQFSADGRFLAARCHPEFGDTNTIFIWNIGQDKGSREKPAPPRRLIGRLWDFHPNKPYLAAACADSSLRLHDLSGARPTTFLDTNESVKCLAFDPEGRRLAAARMEPFHDSGEEIYPVSVYNAETAERLLRLRAPACVYGLSWRADGRRLAGAAADGNVYIWEPPVERPVKTLIGHQKAATYLAFHPKGELLASIGWDGVVRLWDAEMGRQLLSSSAASGPLRFSCDGRSLALSLDGVQMGLYDIDRGNACRTLRGRTETDAGLGSATFHPHKPLLATTGDDGVRLWDVQSGREIASKFLRDCKSALFHADGELLTSSAFGLQRWRLTSSAGADNDRPRLECVPWDGPLVFGTRRMALAEKSQTLAVLIDDHQAVFLGGDRWTKRLMDRTAPRCASIALSPDGQWAATGTWHGNGTRIWDLHNGRQVGKELPGGDACVAFSPDGRWLVNGTRDAYCFWEVGSWRLGLRIPRTPQAGPGRIAFTADTKITAIAHSLREVRLIETATGRELATLAAPDLHLINWLCFRPDGDQLAVACENGVLQLWDLRRIRERLAEMGLDWEHEGASVRPKGDSAD